MLTLLDPQFFAHICVKYKQIFALWQIRKLEKGDQNSKSLLANVLDMEGDFILDSGGQPLQQDYQQNEPFIEKELHSILQEIRVISNKIRAEVWNLEF